MNTEVESYLQKYFPGLQLRRPLFYSWKIGLRFELGLPLDAPAFKRKQNSPGIYFTDLVQRASTIFQKIFPPNEELLLVYQFQENIKREKAEFKFLQRQTSLLPTIGVQLEDLCEESSMMIQEIPWKRVSFSISPKNLKYGRIFEAIANNDFGSKVPKLSGDLFFLSKSKAIILFMYDDRGLDVISKDLGTIESLFNEFRGFIFEQNMPGSEFENNS